MYYEAKALTDACCALEELCAAAAAEAGGVTITLFLGATGVGDPAAVAVIVETNVIVTALCTMSAASGMYCANDLRMMAQSHDTRGLGGAGSGGSPSTQGSGNSNIPVKDKTRASNGLDYQSNQKHAPGQIGNRPNAGIEPKNSLDLFKNSVPSTKNPNQRFTFDKNSDTLHRFSNDGNDTWHWSGSTNQGANSLSGTRVPSDIKNIFGLPKKGW